MGWIDSHCHLTDQRLDQRRVEVISRAYDLGIDFFMLGGVEPQEWERQLHLSLEYPGRFGLAFGLHPYFIAENDEEVCELALDRLARRLATACQLKEHQVLGLGETGLDFRPHIMKDSQDRQIRFFENQIELGHMLKLPLVLHLVQSHEKALMVLDFFGPSQEGGMVHAFSGSLDVALQFIRRGFLISVGGAVTKDKNQKLQHAVKNMPLEWLILETDSPDQPPAGWKKEINEPASLYEVALKVGQLRGITAGEVLDLSAHNFRRVFMKTYKCAEELK